MNRYCPICNKIHDINRVCQTKPNIRERNSEADKIRNTNRWKRKSIEIRERDKYLCVHCMSKGIATWNNLSVHHIIPLLEDKEKAFDDDNLITLCEQCHKQAEDGKIDRELLLELASKGNV